jgi:prolyl oligopeptidase
LEELMRAPSLGPITKAGKRYFFRQRLNDQEISALYFKAAPLAEAQLLIDPSELSSDHAITLADIHPSCDGSFLAYRLSVSGSSRMSLHVMNVDTKEVLPKAIDSPTRGEGMLWIDAKERTYGLQEEGTVQETAPTLRITDGEVAKAMSAEDKTRCI